MVDEHARVARGALDAAGWDLERSERLLRRTRDAIARRRRRAVGYAAAAAVVLTLGAAGLWAAQPGERKALDGGSFAGVALHVATPVDGAWSLRVGHSRALALTDQTQLEMAKPEHGMETIALTAGSARFEAHGLRVLVGDAVLQAEYAVFVVRSGVAGASVTVEDGSVTVVSERFVREAGSGQSVEIGAPPPPATPEPSSVRKGPSKKPRWRVLVKAGEYEQAYAAMKREDPRAVRGSVATLMAAADAARYSGHPAEAPLYLELVVQRHSAHAVAPLAAFTLGRVYLEQLGRPDKAASAFARARKLAPRGSLAGDALAREVEAWAKAGNRDKARQRADQYLERYPKGRRARSVRRHAGMDSG